MTEMPCVYEWDGDYMVPLPRFKKLCDQQFTVGEVYTLEVMQHRSMVSHNHFFATVAEAWKNLGEDLLLTYPTPDALRKRALIKAGYADETSFVCSSKAEAIRLANFLGPLDPYAVVLVRGATIRRFVAQSQSMKSMGKKVFQESKEAVFHVLAELIGVDPATLSAQNPPDPIQAPQRASYRGQEPPPPQSPADYGLPSPARSRASRGGD